MQKLRRLLMSLALILAGTMLWAQQVTIQGTVLDDLGEGLPGAMVKEKDATPVNGTITNIDGQFSLKVKPGATLVISFMGFDTRNFQPKMA